MSLEQIKRFSKGFNWLLQLSMTGMIAFCTFVLSQVWTGYKEHEQRDEQTFNKVIRLEESDRHHTEQINFLTGRVEIISDRQNKSQ